MRRHLIALGALIIATLAVALTAHANPDFDFTEADPTGDTFGLGPVQHDITSVSGSSDGTNFVLTVQFADAIGTPDSGSPSKLGGFVTFDTDQDLSTGQNVDDEIAQFCPERIDLGAEANLAIFMYAGGTAPLITLPPGTVFDIPVTFDTNSFTATIPLSALGGDELFNFTVMMGGNDPKSDEEITDCAPGDGGHFDTAGVVVGPPTATQPVPTPTAQATVGPTTLPATGATGAGGGGNGAIWVVLGAFALAAVGSLSFVVWRRGATG